MRLVKHICVLIHIPHFRFILIKIKKDIADILSCRLSMVEKVESKVKHKKLQISFIVSYNDKNL